MADNSLSRSQQLLADMDAKYGKTSSSAPVEPVAPPPVQPAPQPAAKKPGGMLEGAINLIGNRNKQIDKAAGYSLGGKVGKRSFQYGGSTDGAVLEDDGAMAAGLGLIDQGRQQQAMAQQDLAQKFSEINGYACGGKVKAHADGGKVKACATGAKIKTIKGPGTSTSDSIPAKVKETGEKILVSNGERILSKKQDKLLEKIAKMLGYETTDELLASGTGRPVGPTMKDGKKAAALGWNNNIEDEYTKALNPPVTSPVVPPGETPRQQKDFSGEFLGGLKNWMASKTPVASEEEAAKLRGVDDPFIVGPGAVSRTMMRQAGNALVHEPLVENKQQGAAGKKLTLPENPAMSPNPSGVLAKLTGSYPTSTTENYVEQNQATSPLITGRNDKGIITAESANAFSDSGGLAGMKSGSFYGTSDLAGQNDRMAKSLGYAGADDFNQKQNDFKGYAPGIIGNGSLGTLPGGQSIEEWNRNVGVKTQLGLDPRARVAYEDQAAKNEVQRRGQDFTRETSMYGNDVQAQRAAGHDQVIAAGDILRYGNPLDTRKKQIEVAGMEEMAGLRGKALAGDPKAVALLNSLSGHPVKDRFTPHVVGGGVNELGQPLPQYLAVTGPDGNVQFHQPGTKTQAAAPKAGEVRNGYKFKGGNPADQASWEKV